MGLLWPVLIHTTIMTMTNNNRILKTQIFFDENLNLNQYPSLCFCKEYMQLVDIMMTKNVNNRPNYKQLLTTQIMQNTAKKEGYSGAVDSKIYFSSIIEEINFDRQLKRMV